MTQESYEDVGSRKSGGGRQDGEGGRCDGTSGGR